MNELERLIANLARPEPTAKLDERVNAVLSRTPASMPRPRWQSTLILCGTSACIWLIGFYLGRQSVRSTIESTANRLSGSVLDPGAETVRSSANVTRTPLREDQLAGLFLRPGVREGMLGNGPVTIEISTSP